MKTAGLLLLILSFVGLSTGVPSSISDEDDADLSVPQIIEKYGYPCEEYFVTTPDGYILDVHRIPHGKGSNQTSDRVIFLMHGIESSSAAWILAGPEKALAYTLAGEGYDVWMGNARGNRLSRNHTTLDPDHSSEFWQFSWHEIGITDVPTMIDFALEKSGRQSLFYIGHSQGTTAFYVMASERPEYNDKITAQFSLAPIGFMSHMISPLLRIIALWTGPGGALLELIGVDEFAPNADFVRLAGDIFCGDDDITQFLCTNMLFLICGYSPSEMNATLLPTIDGHTPAGASTKQVLHYGQEVNSGYFRQYDYGLLGNMDAYGSISPPDYDLDKITAPVYLYYSYNDWLSAAIDVDKLYGKLPNGHGKFLVANGSFNHLDYIFGVHAYEYVYSKIISLMSTL